LIDCNICREGGIDSRQKISSNRQIKHQISRKTSVRKFLIAEEWVLEHIDNGPKEKRNSRKKKTILKQKKGEKKWKRSENRNKSSLLSQAQRACLATSFIRFGHTDLDGQAVQQYKQHCP
jgi:hypothetical protein